MNVEKELNTIKQKIESIEAELKKDEKFEECNGLMWSNSVKEGVDWYQAGEFAEKCRDGGFSDWRLPTVSELQNVFDYEKGESKISGWVDDARYWSATTQSSATHNAWLTNQGNGFTYNGAKAHAGYSVRCCRGI